MTKPNIKPFNRGPLSFRLLEEDDLILTLEWRNQDRVRSQLLNSGKIEYEDHFVWFKKYSEKEDDFTFIISERKSGRPIGQVAVYGIINETKSAEFGRLMIGEIVDLDKGYGQIATFAMIDFAFRQRNLEHLVLVVKRDNKAAIKIYERCGFNTDTVDDNVIKMDIVSNLVTKPHIEPFSSGPLSFRLLEEDDLILILEWRNKDRVRTRLFDSNRIEYEDHLSWFKQYSKRDDDFTFVISERESGRSIGLTAIYGIVNEIKAAEYGRLMIGDDQDLGKGYGQIATLAMIDFAFRQLGLRHLFGYTKRNNHAAIKVDKRCGFSASVVDDHVFEMNIFSTKRNNND